MAQVTTENASLGLKFSWNMYRNFMAILIYATAVSYETWGFLSPFTWDVRFSPSPALPPPQFPV